MKTLAAVDAARFRNRLNVCHEFGHAISLLYIHPELKHVAIGRGDAKLFCKADPAHLTKGVALAGLAAAQGRLAAFTFPETRQSLLALEPEKLYAEMVTILAKHTECEFDWAQFQSAPAHPKDAMAVHAAWAVGVALSIETADQFLGDCYDALCAAPDIGICFDRNFIQRFFDGEGTVPLMLIDQLAEA